MRKLKSLFGFFLSTAFLGSLLVGVAQGTIEFCTPGISSVVYRLTNANCPFGVLFAKPVDSTCFQSNDVDIDNYLADLCPNQPFSQNMQQIHLIAHIDETPLEDTCLGDSNSTQYNQCNVSEVVELTNDMLTEPDFTPGAKEDLAANNEEDYIHSDGKESQVNETSTGDKNETRVLSQTKRMFKYILAMKESYPTSTGDELVEDEKSIMIGRKKRSCCDLDPKSIWSSNTEDITDPPLRLLQMLDRSFKILAKHCDKRFVPSDFKKDVEIGFSFLFKEAITSSQIEDISEEDFNIIMLSLESCLSQNTPIQLDGTRCRTSSKIDQMYKIVKSKHRGMTNARISPKSNEFSFQWGKYDMPIDAAWGTMDFVHGLCYGTFKEHVNSNHLYQRALEALFNPELLYRWERPQKLYDEGLWNKMFSTPSVQNTMTNLDACIQAAYFQTPFLHRLERPINHFKNANGNSTLRRKKRASKKWKARDLDQIPQESYAVSLEELGLKGGGWCFQTEAELREKTLIYLGLNCYKYPIVNTFKADLPWLFSSKDESSSTTLVPTN